MTQSVLSERADRPAHTHQANVSAETTLGTEEFAALLAPLDPRGAIAVAVSGGADSMALTHLAAEWARRIGRRIAAVTVDHGLRAESAAEASRVHAWLAGAGIGHAVLRWEGEKPVSGIHAAARAARYRLIGAWCRANGIGDVLVAHHRDDQSETMLLRLARGSGATGLAAMAAISEREGVRLLRPLLSVPKARLMATLVARGQPWIEDPSNANPRFGRTRVRSALRGWGDAATGLATRARAFGLLRQEEEAAAAMLLQTATHDALGVCRMPLDALRADTRSAPRALAHVLRIVGGRDYAPEQTALQRLADWLLAGREGQRSLHRCVVTSRKGEAAVRRELRELPWIALSVGREAPWDGRYTVCLEGAAPAVHYEVGPLRGEDWPILKRQFRGAADRAAALSLPALYGDGRLLAAPQLGLLDPSSTLRVSPLPGRTLAFRPFAVVSSPG